MRINKLKKQTKKTWYKDQLDNNRNVFSKINNLILNEQQNVNFED